MSQVLVDSPKHCAKKGFKVTKFINRKILYVFSTFFSTIISLIFLIWLTLHPSKPEFLLRQADIYQLNLSGPHLLNSSIQITLVSKNPNTKVGIFYDQLQVCASYKGQQITIGENLPPFYQGHEDSNILSASLMGVGIPVSPSFGYEVSRDQTVGELVLSLKINGRLRWKVGAWVSSRYRFNVNCVTVMAFGPINVVGSGPVSAKQGSQCSTTV
ncbi:hypothetical protein MKW94_001281 [Papaver nudicaule]|uniref:Late embryogenesis abundant protein LEA-2 subgroup domain-containing protein n=1 Tax=Papaver nudicaule TaxID=74823 RepID=A0AA41S0X5_PAPNU|nr:hypothetical protein [Papaver nudicaule]